MITETIAPPPTTHKPSTAGYLTRLVAGPVVFALVMWAPVALPYAGHVTLATFAWAAAWWIAEPLPWAVSAMLPFLVFPAAGVMDIVATMRLYGQPIFFWIMGTVLMGYAIEKHGLAHRFTIAFLALPGLGGKTTRLTFAYMLIVGLISVFVSDAATIAMTIPIGMSIVRHTRPQGERKQFAAFMTLATLYAAIAGGTATIIGVPHNAIVMAALQRLTGQQLGFFEWMKIGIPIFIVFLLIFYAVLWVMLPPEVREVPSGDAFIRLGEVQVQREDWAAAIAAVQRGVDKGQLKDPGNAQLMLGIAHYSQKEFAAARPFFERARQSDKHRQIADSYLQAIKAQG